MSYVRDPLGEPLLCCWDDCGQYGHGEIPAYGPGQDGQTLTYVFCSERHLDYWKHSHTDNGNLPAGSRRGLWVPGR